MKKLFLAFMLSMGVLPVAAKVGFAGDPGDPANQQPLVASLVVSMPEMLGFKQILRADVELIEENPGTTQIDHYQWSVRPVDADGNIGEPVFTEDRAGDPSGAFEFPESMTSSLVLDSKYTVILTAWTSLDDILISFPKNVYYSQFTLTGPTEVCCGDPVTVNGIFSGDYMTLGMQYQWLVTKCDAQGNVSGTPHYNSGLVTGFPVGAFTVPNSSTMECNQHYRIDLLFDPSPFGSRPVRRTVIVYVTSFMLTGNSTFCAGQQIILNGRYCPGPNAPVVNGHMWMMYYSNAAGAQLNWVGGSSITPGVPSGNFAIPGSQYNPAGYFLVKLIYLNGSTQVGLRTKLVYMNPAPAAAITGTTSCAYGSYSATPTGPGYTYAWSAFNGTTPFGAVYSNGSTCNVGSGSFNTVKVTVMDATGCPGKATKSVTTNFVDADFHINIIPFGGNNPNYYIQIVRTGNYQTVATDYITIEGVSPYSAPQSLPCWTIPISWPTPVVLSGYNGSTGGLVANNCVINTQSLPMGTFVPGRTYQITHSVSYNSGTCFSMAIHTFNENGCNGCWRTGSGAEEGGEIAEAATAFSVYPNPSNGSFTVQLAEEATNAQAELFDMMGKRVDAFTFSGTSYNYSPAQALAPGIYMLRVMNNGVQSTQKLIVE